MIKTNANNNLKRLWINVNIILEFKTEFEFVY